MQRITHTTWTNTQYLHPPSPVSLTVFMLGVQELELWRRYSLGQRSSLTRILLMCCLHYYKVSSVCSEHCYWKEYKRPFRYSNVIVLTDSAVTHLV